MRCFKSAFAALVLGCAVLSWSASLSLASAKQYQVTGKLLAVTDKVLTVEKGDEKWEIDRTSDLKVTGKLEVGEKVTIYYHMVADSAEVKKK